MKTPRLLSVLWVSLVLAAAGILPAAAQLPTLDNQPWLGYFAVFANGRYHFTVDSNGLMHLTPMGDKREPVSSNIAIAIQIAVEELMPDGKITVKQIDASSLQSAQPVTDKLAKVVITGKVTGGAAFEATVEQARGTIFMGGRVTDPGTLKNTLRFALYAKVPPLYPNAKKISNKKEEAAHEKKLAGDRITVKGIDGKRRKETLGKRVDSSSADLTGTGLVSVEIETAAYLSKKCQFVASPNSMLTLKNESGGPLSDGVLIRWEADKTKDPEGKARFAFEVK